MVQYKKLKICGLSEVEQVKSITALDKERRPHALGFQKGDRFLRGGSPASLGTIQKMVEVACENDQDPYLLMYGEDEDVPEINTLTDRLTWMLFR